MIIGGSIQKRRQGGAYLQCLAAITANLGIICSDMHYGWSSPSIPILLSGNYTFTITSKESSWLVVIPPVGAILGAFITGLVADMFGRKTLLIFSSIPFIISWLFIAWARNSTLMFIGRFLAGMTDGLSFNVVLMYLGEIAEPKIRGLIASVCPVCITLGFLLINILGSYFSIGTTAYSAIALPITLLLTFIWMPESPYFYLIKGRIEDARRSLQIFRGRENVNLELEQIAEAVEKQNQNRGRYLDLLTNQSNRRTLIIALGLRTIQQLSGAMTIIFYCKEIFEESDLFISPTMATIIYFGVQLIMSSLTSIVVDFSGRRPLLIVSTIGTALTLFLNGTYLYFKHTTFIDMSSFNFLPILALLLYVVMFSIGLQTIPVLIMGEVFPTNVKAFALCLGDIYFSVIVAIVSKLFHWSNEEFGMYVPFFGFGTCCILGLIFIIFYVPETKGKTLEDIQRELGGEKL